MIWVRNTVPSSLLVLYLAISSSFSIMGSDAANIVAEAEAFVNKFNTDYEAKHLAFENQFWGTKMALSGDFSAEKLSKTKTEMEDLLSDYGRYIFDCRESSRREENEKNFGLIATGIKVSKDDR